VPLPEGGVPVGVVSSAIDDLQPQSIGELLDAAVIFAIRHFVPLAAIVVGSSAPAYLPQSISATGQTTTLWQIFRFIMIWSADVFGMCAAAIVVDHFLQSKKLTLRELCATILRALWPLIVAWVRYAILFCVTFVICALVLLLLKAGASMFGFEFEISPHSAVSWIIIGLVFAFPLALVWLASNIAFVHAVLGHSEHARAFPGGATVLRPFDPHIAEAALVPLILAGGPLLLTLPLSLLHNHGLQIVIADVLSIITLPCLYVFVTLLYFDLRARHGGTDLDTISASLRVSETSSSR